MKKDVLVSASDIADASYCGYRLANKINKLPVSKESIRQSKRGIKAHDKQNRVGVDRRCYIASYAYGEDALETSQFRLFRDVVLLKIPFGPSFVRFYYLLSPCLVKLSFKFKSIDVWVRRCLGSILRSLS